MKLRFYVVGRERRRKGGTRLAPPAVERRVNGHSSEHYIGLPDRRVSRRHAEVYVLNGRIFVRDLGSKNGTFVVDQGRVRKLTEGYVRPNQIVSFGGRLERMANLIREHSSRVPDSQCAEDSADTSADGANPDDGSGGGS